MDDTPVAREPRFDTRRVAAEAHQALVELDSVIDLDSALWDLVKIRASILNGCAFCIQLHTQDALKAGERAERLFALGAWEESPFFTARERAALGFTDAVTRLPQGGIGDDVYDEARAHLDEAELPQLLFAVVSINAWNRLAVATRKRTLPAR